MFVSVVMGFPRYGVNLITQFVRGSGSASIYSIIRISFAHIYWPLNTLGFEVIFSRYILYKRAGVYTQNI